MPKFFHLPGAPAIEVEAHADVLSIYQALAMARFLTRSGFWYGSDALPDGSLIQWPENLGRRRSVHAVPVEQYAGFGLDYLIEGVTEAEYLELRELLITSDMKIRAVHRDGKGLLKCVELVLNPCTDQSIPETRKFERLWSALGITAPVEIPAGWARQPVGAR